MSCRSKYIVLLLMVPVRRSLPSGSRGHKNRSPSCLWFFVLHVLNLTRCLFSPRVPQVLLTIHYIPVLQVPRDALISLRTSFHARKTCQTSASDVRRCVSACACRLLSGSVLELIKITLEARSLLTEFPKGLACV